MEVRVGDRIVFTQVDPEDYYSITTGKAYMVYEDSDGWKCISDDDGDEAYITNQVGEERAWVERASYYIAGASDGAIMIDAEELLKYISETSAIYGMNVAQVQEYLKGYIKGRKGEIK